MPKNFLLISFTVGIIKPQPYVLVLLSSNRYAAKFVSDPAVLVQV